jgi:NAD(P)-dependent dehydrogenase (short-subunit alcohol dehydrogenase family)
LKNEEDKIDVLINNAGVYQNRLEFSEDEIEKTIAVNYHSHFILILLLIPLLENSSDPRIINFSSMVHAHNLDIDNISDPIKFNGSQAYSDSKLAMILFTFKLAKILDKIKVNCLHSGVINKKFLQQGWGAGGSSVEQVAETPVYLALSNQIKGESGAYFVNKKKKQAASAASEQEIQDQLWNKSIEMIKYKGILNKISERFLEA